MTKTTWDLLTATLPRPLREWFGEVRRMPLFLAGDSEKVACENLQAFSIGSGGCDGLAVEDVARFLRSVAGFWREAIIASTEVAVQTPWCFYAWTDDMSAQLRFSVAPAGGIQDLSFSCALREVGPDDIARRFLGSHDIIPLADLTLGPESADQSEAEFVLDVWVQLLS